MPKKSKSHSEAVQNSPTAKMKIVSDKKVIVCHCWPGIYEAAHRIMNDFTRKKLNSKKLSMSEFINLIISHTHCLIFGEFPDVDNENSNNSKGEN